MFSRETVPLVRESNVHNFREAQPDGLLFGSLSTQRTNLEPILSTGQRACTIADMKLAVPLVMLDTRMQLASRRYENEHR